MQAPTMPKGSSILISPQTAFLRLVPPRTSDAVKSSASTRGTAKVSGCESASSGTEIRADPKPVMPRMKYALIKMHSTRTMSATAAPLLQPLTPALVLLLAQHPVLQFTLFCNLPGYVFVYYRKSDLSSEEVGDTDGSRARPESPPLGSDWRRDPGRRPRSHQRT